MAPLTDRESVFGWVLLVFATVLQLAPLFFLSFAWVLSHFFLGVFMCCLWRPFVAVVSPFHIRSDTEPPFYSTSETKWSALDMM